MREAALAASFAAAYVIFGFLRISPIIGLPGQTVTAAAIIAPIIGTILGSYLGAFSTFLGGTIGMFSGSISPPSFISGIVAASCGGLIQRGKRYVAVFLYLILLLGEAFYPLVGSAWLYPPLIWFQTAVLIILVSPLQLAAVKSLRCDSNRRLFFGYFVISLISTVAGQIAGSLTLLILIPSVDYWSIVWKAIVLLYPIERIVIAFGAALVGASLHKVLRHANIMLSDTEKLKDLANTRKLEQAR